MIPRLATIDGRTLASVPTRPVALSLEFESDLFAVYQAAKSRLDNSRLGDDPTRERWRIEAMGAFDIYADASGNPRIQNRLTWGFN